VNPKKLLPGALACCLLSGAPAAADINVIPRPAQIARDADAAGVALGASHIIVCADAALGRVYADTLFERTGLRLPVHPAAATAAGRPVIAVDCASLSTDSHVAHPEGYALAVAADGAVRVEASARAGAFYALQTLAQLAARDGDGDAARVTLPVVRIHDSPRFRWRGVLLDEGRHFFGPAAVKRLLDSMALYKFNTLHWHLTDDQGWRMEIKKYPRLTQTGAWRVSSPTPGNRDLPDGVPHGGYYTQDEIREIVAYARQRAITVIPEVEIPGHSSAALAAYPGYGNTDIPGYAPAVQTTMGVKPYIYAPKEETFRFLRDVLDEVCALFPDSPYIHIGGDEAPKTQWKASPFAQKVIRENDLKDEFGLQSWFIRRVEKHLNSRGRRIVGWDEIQEGGLSPTATMMVWRDWKWARLAIEKGNDVVMTPHSHCYIDYAESVEGLPDDPYYEHIGIKRSGNRPPRLLPLEKVYQFEPIPEGTPPEREKQVIGCQANLWGEYLFDWNRAEYNLYPRLFAMAEVAWSPKAARDWPSFQERLPAALRRLDQIQANYRRPDGAPARPRARE
jgi:hexosaminidase